MQISHNGVEFIEDAEGFKATAYKDTGGVWTIGYGTTHIDGQPVEQGMTCTQQQAELWMEKDLAPVQTIINQSVKVKITQNMFDALCSFTYNLGGYAFSHSTMCTLINQCKFASAADQFNRWVYDNGRVVPGLVSRRAREKAVFEGK